MVGHTIWNGKDAWYSGALNSGALNSGALKSTESTESGAFQSITIPLVYINVVLAALPLDNYFYSLTTTGNPQVGTLLWLSSTGRGR
jgi:hypothetical protein